MAVLCRSRLTPNCVCMLEGGSTELQAAPHEIRHGEPTLSAPYPAAATDPNLSSLLQIELDCGTNADGDDAAAADTRAEKHASKLAEPVADFTRMIFDVTMMKKAMEAQNIDLDRMPLGSLSKRQLDAGYASKHVCMPCPPTSKQSMVANANTSVTWCSPSLHPRHPRHGRV